MTDYGPRGWDSPTSYLCQALVVAGQNSAQIVESCIEALSCACRPPVKGRLLETTPYEPCYTLVQRCIFVEGDPWILLWRS